MMMISIDRTRGDRGPTSIALCVGQKSLPSGPTVRGTLRGPRSRSNGATRSSWDPKLVLPGTGGAMQLCYARRPPLLLVLAPSPRRVLQYPAQSGEGAQARFGCHPSAPSAPTDDGAGHSTDIETVCWPSVALERVGGARPPHPLLVATVSNACGSQLLPLLRRLWLGYVYTARRSRTGGPPSSPALARDRLLRTHKGEGGGEVLD